jgi:hypothetical protein
MQLVAPVLGYALDVSKIGEARNRELRCANRATRSFCDLREIGRAAGVDCKRKRTNRDENCERLNIETIVVYHGVGHECVPHRSPASRSRKAAIALACAYLLGLASFPHLKIAPRPPCHPEPVEGPRDTQAVLREAHARNAPVGCPLIASFEGHRYRSTARKTTKTPSNARFSRGAQDWTRTSTRLLPLAPQASASTNSATCA